MAKNPGKIVRTKDGQLGRTYESKGVVNGKVPVYLATETRQVGSMTLPKLYEEKAILCDPKTLAIIGFID